MALQIPAGLRRHEIMACLPALIFVLLLYYFSPLFCYVTDDDISILALVKGLFGLTPGADGLYISPLLGLLLNKAYSFAGAVPWYSLLLYGGIVSAVYFACLAAFQGTAPPGLKLLGAGGAMLFAILVALQVNFSAISLLLWVCAGIFLAVRQIEGASPGFSDGFASLNLGLAYLLRPSLLPLQCVFLLPLLFLLLRGSRRRAAATLGPLLVVLVIAQGGGALIRSGPDFDSYLAFNEVRSRFTDTGLSVYNTRSPQALRAARWSLNDYNVAKNWWLHDGNIFTTERIAAFLANNAGAPSYLNSREGWFNLVEYRLFLAAALAGTLAVVFLARRERPVLRSLLPLYSLAVVVVLMFVRFPERIAYPVFALLFLAVMLSGSRIAAASKVSAVVFNATAVALLLLVSVSVFSIAGSNIAKVAAKREKGQMVELMTREVVRGNGEKTIIVDLNPHILPLSYFPFEENDANLAIPTMLGGWLVDSPAYRDFLARAGLGDRTTLIGRMIDNPKVVFRFWDSVLLSYDTYVEGVFLPHLREHYHPVNRQEQVGIRVVNDFRDGAHGLVFFQLVSERVP